MSKLHFHRTDIIRLSISQYVLFCFWRLSEILGMGQQQACSQTCIAPSKRTGISTHGVSHLSFIDPFACGKLQITAGRVISMQIVLHAESEQFHWINKTQQALNYPTPLLNLQAMRHSQETVQLCFLAAQLQHVSVWPTACQSGSKGHIQKPFCKIASAWIGFKWLACILSFLSLSVSHLSISLSV